MFLFWLQVFFLGSISCNIPSLCFSKYGFRPVTLGFFHPVAGLHFHTLNFVWFVCRKILCVCYNVSGEIVEIVAVYVHIMFSSVGGESVQNWTPLYIGLHENTFVSWIVWSCEKLMVNKFGCIYKKSKEFVGFYYWLYYV